jgi:hypothetical protein
MAEQDDPERDGGAARPSPPAPAPGQPPVPAPGRPERQPAHFRAADTDRQQVADRLRAAMDDGRLSLLEYDERLGKAYAAQTYGELAELTRDLPEPHSPPLVPDPNARPAAPKRRSRFGAAGRSWLGGAVFFNGIWLLTSLPDPLVHYYWPVWPLGVWGIAALSGAVGGKGRPAPGPGGPATGGDPGRDDRRR